MWRWRWRRSGNDHDPVWASESRRQRVGVASSAVKFSPDELSWRQPAIRLLPSTVLLFERASGDHAQRAPHAAAVPGPPAHAARRRPTLPHNRRQFLGAAEAAAPRAVSAPPAAVAAPHDAAAAERAALAALRGVAPVDHEGGVAVPPGVGAAGGRRREPAARSVAAAAATAAAQLRGFVVEVEPLSPRSRPASAFVGSPREHSSRRVGSAPTARATLAASGGASARRGVGAGAGRAAGDGAVGGGGCCSRPAAPTAELEPLALLRAVDLLSGRTRRRAQLLQLGSLRRYRRYAVVAREGGDVDGLALLLAGSLQRTTQVGSPYGASELRAGDAVDLEALVDGCGALRRDATYEAAEDAVVLVVGKKALSGLALGAARRAAQRRLVRALLKPLKAFRTLQSSALDALSAYFSRGSTTRAVSSTGRANPPIASSSSPRARSPCCPPTPSRPTMTTAAAARRGGGAWRPPTAARPPILAAAVRGARPRWSRPTAPRRRGSAAPPRCSRRAGRRGRARRARWRCGRRSCSRSLRPTPTLSFRSHLSSWPSGRSKRSAPPACDSSSASRRRRRPRPRRATRSASRAGVAWWRSCSRGASASLLHPRGQR